MNKSDIKHEVANRPRELRAWAERLDPASPALAAFYREYADRIEAVGARGYDAHGATKMMGQVNGMAAVADVLLKEWAAHLDPGN